MVRCLNCDGLFDEKELIKVTAGKKRYYLCPECLREFCEEMEESIVDIDEKEESEIRKELEADSLYDELKLEGRM